MATPRPRACSVLVTMPAVPHFCFFSSYDISHFFTYYTSRSREEYKRLLRGHSCFVTPLCPASSVRFLFTAIKARVPARTDSGANLRNFFCKPCGVLS
jgi:hypothetical protein